MMKSVVSLLLLFIGLTSNLVAGTPREDLASPSQEIRDAAAAWLRQNYVPVPESHWTAFVAKVKEAKNKAEVLALLKPLGAIPGMGFAGGRAYTQTYQLDDEWLLSCSFTEPDDSLFVVRLEQSMQRIMPIADNNSSKPDQSPTKCTLYFANGQKSCDIEYTNGHMGPYVSYYPTGQKAVEQNYLPDGTTGEETGYYRSGKISYTTRYAADKQSKITIWYDEQGAAKKGSGRFLLFFNPSKGALPKVRPEQLNSFVYHINSPKLQPTGLPPIKRTRVGRELRLVS